MDVRSILSRASSKGTEAARTARDELMQRGGRRDDRARPRARDAAVRDDHHMMDRVQRVASVTPPMQATAQPIDDGRVIQALASADVERDGSSSMEAFATDRCGPSGLTALACGKGGSTRMMDFVCGDGEPEGMERLVLGP